MDRRQLTGFVCFMMLLGASCASADKDPIGVDADAGSDAAPLSAAGSEHGSLGDPNVRAKLRDLALQASSIAGVSTPRTMIAVASPDHQAAERVISGAIINDHAPVYVIVMTGGRFTAIMAPFGVSPPQGDVLTLTVDAATYRVTDAGIVNAEPDLSKIASGSPVDLSVN